MTVSVWTIHYNFVQYIGTIYNGHTNHHYKSEINDTTIISTQL